MTLPRVSLGAFLATAKGSLKNVTQQSMPFTFVVGNESADLDSLCSAIVFAYIQTYSSSHQTSQIHIPLSNLPRADLSLRSELRPVLSKARLTANDLITLSDLPSSPSQSYSLRPQDTRWLLVDHNVLQSELGSLYGSRVVGCIDHHDDEGKVPIQTQNEPRIISKSGSCSSLIVQYCRDAWDGMASKSRSSDSVSWDAELARLALAPILIDTVNLKAKSKVAPADTQAVEYLEAKITAAQEMPFSRDEFYKEISDAKQDISVLSMTDVMRKDFKEWTEGGVKLGISCVVKDFSFVVEKAGSETGFLDSVREYAMQQKLSIISVMTTFSRDEEFSRELLVWALDKSSVEMARKFEKAAGEALGLQTWQNGRLDNVDHEGEWRRCWVQEKVENSRKQVAPMIRQSML